MEGMTNIQHLRLQVHAPILMELGIHVLISKIRIVDTPGLVQLESILYRHFSVQLSLCRCFGVAKQQLRKTKKESVGRPMPLHACYHVTSSGR